MTVSVIFQGVRADDGELDAAFEHYGAAKSSVEIVYGETRFVLNNELTREALRNQKPIAIGECIAVALDAGDGIATVVHAGARAICHITGAEGDAPARLRNAALHSDLLIFGGAWADGLRFKHALCARLLAIIDHPVECTDVELAATAAEVAALHPDVFFARSGCKLDL